MQEMELAQEKSGIKTHKAHADRNKGTGGAALAEHPVLGQIPAPDPQSLHSKDLLHSTGKMQHRLISFIPVPNAVEKGWKCTSKGGQ